MITEGDIDIQTVNTEELLNVLDDYPTGEMVTGSICPVCLNPLFSIPILWITYCGLGDAMDLFIHPKCKRAFDQRKAALLFTQN